MNCEHRASSEDILPVVYEELRRLAHRWMRQTPPGETIQPTALVHEAYLRLSEPEGAQWNGRGHFFAAASLAMRRILVEIARRKASAKHGGKVLRFELREEDLAYEVDAERMLALDEALAGLEERDERAAQVVMLRYFSGLNIDQVAGALELAPRTVQRDWAVARAWLGTQLDDRNGSNMY